MKRNVKNVMYARSMIHWFRIELLIPTKICCVDIMKKKICTYIPIDMNMCLRILMWITKQTMHTVKWNTQGRQTSGCRGCTCTHRFCGLKSWTYYKFLASRSWSLGKSRKVSSAPTLFRPDWRPCLFCSSQESSWTCF